MAENNEIIEFIRKKNYIMLDNSLGSGSFGKTVLLKDPYIDELFVAKKYEPQIEDEQLKKDFYKNFLEEIKILYKLNHKNIVRIFNYYAYDNKHTGFIIMEYIEGKNIKDYLDTLSFNLDDIFIQIIEAFSYIESLNIIHRDIRESNILIDNSGTVKIIDFGIGKIAEENFNFTDSLGSKINRPTILPKEYNAKIYTNKTDMFYIAELLNRLFHEANPFLDDFSYQNILDKMMKNDPKDRYNSFEEIKNIINKKQFEEIFNEQNKEIYLDFANSLYNALVSFTDERNFKTIPEFISKIESTLTYHHFEDFIQKNTDLLSAIISSKYTYRQKSQIEVSAVKDFYDWFISLSDRSKNIVFDNLLYKLSLRGIEIDYDVPF